MANIPSNYYYKYDTAGKRLFFFQGKRIARKDIPVDIIDQVKLGSNEKKEELLKVRHAYEVEIKRLKELIRQLDIKIQSVSGEKPDREWEEMFKRYYQRTTQEKKATTDDDFLSSHGITTKKEWRDWLKKNHSDKNESIDVDLLQRIIACGKAKDWKD